MPFLMLFFMGMVSLFSPMGGLNTAQGATTSVIRPATTGFYPIWENTGYVQPHRQIYIGTTGVHFGILDRAHLGFNPIQWLYRTPNLYLKLDTYRTDTFRVAVNIGLFRLEEKASRAALSPTYTSRLANANYAVNLLPLAIATSYELTEWLAFHQTLTYLNVINSGPLKSQGTLGYSFASEFQANAHHALSLHFTEVGFYNHDFHSYGGSYRYQAEQVDFRFGYFYRIRKAGQEAGPLVGIGVTL